MGEYRRRLEAQQAVHDLIARHAPLEETLDAVSRMVEALLPEARVSVMRFDPDARTLSIVGGAAFPTAYRELVTDLPIGPEVGTCGVAAHRRALVITEHIAQDPHWADYRHLAREAGIAACWSSPVLADDGELLGTFATYYPRLRRPTEQELARIEGITGLVALALERHRDRARLAATEQRYRSLYTQHPHGVFECDRDGRVLSGNAALQRITGHAEPALPGRHVGGLVVPEARASCLAAFARALQGEAQSLERQGLHASGTVYWLEMTLLPIVVGGEVVGVYGICRDNSLRKRHERELRLLGRGVEASHNGIVMADATAPDMPLVYVNQAFLALSGYRHDEVLGRNCRFLQGPDSDAATVDRVRRALSRHRDVEVVLRNYRKDGTPFWNRLSIGPVFDDAGACTHFIGILQDITRQREREALLARQATHDQLTWLPNREHFVEHLERDFTLSRQCSGQLAVLYVDLDDFQPINDALGHLVGDRLLVAVAKRLEGLLQPGATLGRAASDEFAILLPSLGEEGEATRLAEAVLRSLSRPFAVDRHRLHVSASIGIASSREASRGREVLQYADLAMRAAKQQGRNTWQWYAGDVSSEIGEHLRLRQALQHAIAEEAFELHYQPIVDATVGRTRCLEALIRWPRPGRGLVSPGVFIPVAEQTGQIIDIGHWVLRRACRDLATLRANGRPDLRVAVNISPLQFRRASFVEEVRRALRDTGLPADRLELEVTEGVLMSDTDPSIARLQALRGMGVRIAIDDFGTGFSSLGYLRDLPINKVKLDRSFIRDITTSPRDAAIVQGIITMAHHLELAVVAEGVETREQDLDLRFRGCDYLQGFRFGRPQPLAELDLSCDTSPPRSVPS